MCLSPVWVDFLTNHGLEALHWSTIGSPSAPDFEIMAFAAKYDFVVFTHDLDFSALLAMTGAAKPSVIQIRAQDILPDSLGAAFLHTVRDVEMHLLEGRSCHRGA